ncbi:MULTISPECIES: MarR family winged helix-turn-helix transcriptional regulator [unclassified Agrococcus]|uniref:MarR family winged helix-turn-helix transcriptional regulator n=1 Tax=unclassified Agrococcus TaxID=2615065 RepID=UPI003609396F
MTDPATVAEALEELRLAEARLERRREALSEPGDIERSVLRHVFACADRDDPATPSELAVHVGLSRPAISTMLRRLEHEGLVALRPHPGDGRSKIVLPVSRNDHLDGDDALTDGIRAVAARLSHDEAQTVARFLDELREVVDRSTPVDRAAALGDARP